MSHSGKQTPLSQDDYWQVSHAAGRVTSYACSVSARHIRDGMLRLQFNREVAYYMRGIVRDVADGRKTSAEGLIAIQKEQQSLLSQSRTIALQSLGIVAGGFQIAGGAAMCVGSGGLACTLGVITVAHGANNIYENGRNLVMRTSNTEGPVRKIYKSAAKVAGGSESIGNIAYNSADISLSLYGLYRKIPSPDSWRLFRYIDKDLIRTYKTTRPPVIAIDTGADAVSSYGIYDELNKDRSQGE